MRRKKSVDLFSRKDFLSIRAQAASWARKKLRRNKQMRRKKIALSNLHRLKDGGTYTTVEAARALRLNAGTIRDAIAAGELKAERVEGHGRGFKYGYKHLVNGGDVVAWAKNTFEMKNGKKHHKTFPDTEMEGPKLPHVQNVDLFSRKDFLSILADKLVARLIDR